eukprot:3800478-Rhodomonas_salina.1
MDGEGRILRPPPGRARATPSFMDLESVVGKQLQQKLKGIAPLVSQKARPVSFAEDEKAHEGPKGFDIAFQRIRVPAGGDDALPFKLKRAESLKRAPSRLFQRNLRAAA